MGKYVCEGKLYNVLSSTFDIVDQRYLITGYLNRVVSYWRRESGKYAILGGNFQITIGDTAHVLKLKEDGKSDNEIANEIFKNVNSYIEYATQKRNEDLVKLNIGQLSYTQDRLDNKEEVRKYLEIDIELADKLVVIAAY